MTRPTNSIWAAFWASMFSFSGRISRGTFIAHTVGGFLLTAVVIMALIIVLAQRPNAVLHRSMLTLSLFTAANQLSLITRRLHDFGVHGSASACIFVPGVNVFFLFVILFTPGQRRPNKYGLPIGVRAVDLLTQGRRYEAKGRWQEAFKCYAGVVESEQFSELEEDAALEALGRLKERLAEAGIVSF